MKFPDDVRQALKRRYKTQHREWLQSGLKCDEPLGADPWPLEVALGVPTERQAQKQLADVRAWVAAWQAWNGAGSLRWGVRRWRTLGTQTVPEKLLLADPRDVASWIGEAERWARAQRRYGDLRARWPQLSGALPRHFDMLADYSEQDYGRLIPAERSNDRCPIAVCLPYELSLGARTQTAHRSLNTSVGMIALLDWIQRNPTSNLYPRQVPVSGLDSKWFEGRKGVLADLVEAARRGPVIEGDAFQRCGLKAPPRLVRLRILDASLRQRLGGLGDISAPWDQLADLDLPARQVFIVENLQTGLAFDDLPGAVVLMGLGYGVDLLGRLPWVAQAQGLYWGDLDTHGFAILNRARAHVPNLRSILMDEATLQSHAELWTQEKVPHTAEALPLLTQAEQSVYQALKRNIWGQNVRLEQERIAWDVAWRVLRDL